MSKNPLILKIVSVVIYLAAFVSVCLFVNTQMNKYDYFIYLYGESTAPGSKALVKVLSRDGELVSNPVVYINGIKRLSSLIDLRPDMKEIKVVFGTTEAAFPLKYKNVADYHFVPQKKLRPTKLETDKAKIVNISGLFRKLRQLSESIAQKTTNHAPTLRYSLTVRSRS